MTAAAEQAGLSARDVAVWAGEPLATAEVATVCGLGRDDARERLREVVVEDPIGPEALWTLP